MDIFSRGRDFGRDNLGLRDGSEMVVADVCVKGRKQGCLRGRGFFHLFIYSFLGEKKRHHHHHHKSSHRSDFREPNLTSNNARREHRHSGGHY